MVQVTPPNFPPTLVDLSRNASVISSSSETDIPSESQKSSRPRPARTFSSPRSQSPQPRTATPSKPPTYLTRELGISSRQEPPQPQQQTKERSKSRKRSREASRARSANGRLGAQEFTFGDTLGEGSYSTVMRARYIRTGQEYAIKILDKNHLIRKDKMLVALAEKNVLVKLGAGHPGIIHLHWTFQDEWSLFFVLDLASNGEMQSRISRLGSLSLTSSRYYAAQIVDALEYMHGKDVIHRDLKPENLLLDDQFRIKITDFGTGKILENGADRAKTFVGTAQYVAPELLESNETSKREEGPMGENPDYLVWQSRTSEGKMMPGLEEDLEETQTVVDEHEHEHNTALPEIQTSPPPTQDAAEPLPPSEVSHLPTKIIPPVISVHVRRVNGTGSGSSSSDGSPVVDRVTADLDIKMRIGSATEAKLEPSLSRGRNRAQTPVQGHGPCSNADWSSLLLPSECVLFHTRVEARSPKRRGSKLRLPISASLTKTKTRQLVLTNMRLLCVKQKGGGQVSLKSEVGLGAGDKCKEREKPREGKEKERDASKDCRNVIESAEPKGEREFVILTSNRSQTYAAETSAMSAMWVEKINEALVRGNAHLQTRTQAWRPESR
ncbi:kinase-like protein [Suillus hirtellus]|nr:kinase-like protein [Suillus hirtellus]